MTQFFSAPETEEFYLIELIRLIESGNKITSYNTKKKQEEEVQETSKKLIYSLSRNKEKTQIEPVNYIDLEHDITLDKVVNIVISISPNPVVSAVAIYNIIKGNKPSKNDMWCKRDSVFMLKNHLTEEYRYLVVKYTAPEIVTDRHSGFPYIETAYAAEWKWSVYSVEDDLTKIKLTNLRLWYLYKE